MDGGDFPWNSRLSTSSRRFQSRSEIIWEEMIFLRSRMIISRNFCALFVRMSLILWGLCCHVDEEHPVELKQGVCPICAKRVGMDMVSHLTVQHGNILKVQRKRRSRRGGSSSMFNILRKELRDSGRQSLFGGHSYTLSASSPDPDPLLSSLVYNSHIMEEPGGLEADSSAESKLIELSADENIIKRVEQPHLSEKDQEEKARKCEFVQGLLLSTIFDDTL